MNIWILKTRYGNWLLSHLRKTELIKFLLKNMIPWSVLITLKIFIFKKSSQFSQVLGKIETDNSHFEKKRPTQHYYLASFAWYPLLFWSTRVDPATMNQPPPPKSSSVIEGSHGVHLHTSGFDLVLSSYLD
jgi:hypothetical protein